MEESVKDALLKDIVDNTLTLVTEHGVSHRDIVSAIRSALRNKSKELPPIKVLINKCYGGYQINEAFKAFVMGAVGHDEAWIEDDIGITKDSRVEYTKYIVPFASHLLSVYPFMWSALYMYWKYSMERVCNFANSWIQSQKIVRMTEGKIHRLRELIDNPLMHGKRTYTNNNDMKSISLSDLRYKDIRNLRLEGLTMESYKQGLSELLEYLGNKVEDCQTYYLEGCTLIGEDRFKDIIHFFEENTTIPLPRMTSFVQAIGKYGLEAYKHCVVAGTQFDSQAMTYIFAKLNASAVECQSGDFTFDAILGTQIVDVDEALKLKAMESFGLDCAGGLSSMLAIAEAPNLIDWNIKEYDGKEAIICA
jgi:hypothetical protein